MRPNLYVSVWVYIYKTKQTTKINPLKIQVRINLNFHTPLQITYHWSWYFGPFEGHT